MSSEDNIFGDVKAESDCDTTEEPLTLEAEDGEVAADYLETLLDIAHIDGDIEITTRDGTHHISIVVDDTDISPQLRALIGDEGEVLFALQELMRRAVFAHTGHQGRIVVDILQWREEKLAHVRGAANVAIESVIQRGESVELSPMNAYERKAVHDVVAQSGLASTSVGVGSERRVVIQLADMAP